MYYPQEIEVWYVLPSIRRELAKELVKYNLTQREISSKLNITESAVSQYLREKRANLVKFDNVITKAIQIGAKKIAVKDEIVMKEIQKIINLMRKNKVLCKIHHQYDKDLPENCNHCIYEK